MTTTTGSDRFIILRNAQTLASTVTAEEHGFSAEVVDDRDAACDAVLARIPHGSSEMTNNSVTLDEVGSLDAINGGGHYDPVRAKMAELDYAAQRQDMKAIAGQPEILEIPSELPDRVHVVRIRGVVGF
jgi:hypothetical protein